MSLQLYGYWRSSASYRVRIALNLKNLAYEYIPVHLVKDGGQQKSIEYQRLNPAMLVPSLVDDSEDITLTQSMAIIEYLDEKYPSNIELLPKHIVDRAWVRMLAQDLACDIQPITNLRILQALSLEFNADTQATKKWAHDWIVKGFVALEKRLKTRSGKYSFGYSITLADVCLVPQVYNAIRFEVDMQQFPLIKKVYENCQLLPAFIDAAPQNQPDAD